MERRLRTDPDRAGDDPGLHLGIQNAAHQNQEDHRGPAKNEPLAHVISSLMRARVTAYRPSVPVNRNIDRSESWTNTLASVDRAQGPRLAARSSPSGDACAADRCSG